MYNFTNAKKPNNLFWTTLEHLPAAYIAHGTIKTAEIMIKNTNLSDEIISPKQKHKPSKPA